MRYWPLFLALLASFACQRDRVEVYDDQNSRVHLVFPQDDWDPNSDIEKSLTLVLEPMDGCEGSSIVKSYLYRPGLSFSYSLNKECDYSFQVEISDGRAIYSGERILKAIDFTTKDKFGLIISLTVTEYGKAQGYEDSLHTTGPVLIDWI